MHLRVLTSSLTDNLQGGHPRLEEVAVLEQDPVALGLTFLDHLGCHAFLPLAQTLIVELIIEVHLVRELNDLLSGIRALTQHKDNRCLSI